MYTECPDCETAFRVTAKVLRRANGVVRCGSCGHEFSALDYLSEEMPSPAGEGTDGTDDDKMAETSRRLLETLDELAGPDKVLIEDTGAEWRVLESADEDASQADLPTSVERRYDDNTPVPEDTDNDSDTNPLPPRRKTDPVDDGEEISALQGDLPLSEPGDWTDLLDEVREPESDSLQVEEELAAIHSQLAVRDELANTATEPVDLDAQFETQAEKMGLDIPATGDSQTDEILLVNEIDAEPAMTDEDGLAASESEDVTESVEENDLDQAPAESQEDDSPAQHKHLVQEQTEEEMTINMEIDQEMMAAAIQDDEFSATLVGLKSTEQVTDEIPTSVETIVMEGAQVSGQFDEQPIDVQRTALGQLDDNAEFADTYVLSRGAQPDGRRVDDPPGHKVTATIAVLIIILVGQVIHNSREALAANELMGQVISPVYELLGSPVMPKWNIKGWQFEVTNGTVDDSESSLIIVSRLINNAEQPLPYPLVHVSLTDRWEDIMGSRVLEPGEYLAGDLDPAGLVQPGDRFTAVITIGNPSADATGFKLNVCYRVTPGSVRCATEDFKK
jgi:predicted Zn finger-like uncharacterized protein